MPVLRRLTTNEEANEAEKSATQKMLANIQTKPNDRPRQLTGTLSP